MSIKQNFFDRLTATKPGLRIISEPRYQMILPAVCSLFVNLLYALYHGVLGMMNLSLWFLTMFAYYTVLSIMRFSAVLCGRKSSSTASAETEYFVMKLAGVLLILLTFILSGVICISLSQKIAAKYDEIIMITIAAYTFYKIITAIIKAVKQRKNPSPILAVIRNIGYAEVAASILTLQRSMLTSFGNMSDANAKAMNILTGAAVCIFVFALGIAMIIRGMRKGGNHYGQIETDKGK